MVELIHLKETILLISLMLLPLASRFFSFCLGLSGNATLLWTDTHLLGRLIWNLIWKGWCTHKMIWRNQLQNTQMSHKNMFLEEFHTYFMHESRIFNEIFSPWPMGLFLMYGLKNIGLHSHWTAPQLWVCLLTMTTAPVVRD